MVWKKEPTDLIHLKMKAQPSRWWWPSDDTALLNSVAEPSDVSFEPLLLLFQALQLGGSEQCELAWKIHY